MIVRLMPLLCLTASGCGGIQSVLAPVSPQARQIGSLWWTFFWVLAATFVLVLGATAAASVAAARRRRREPDAPPSTHDDPATHRKLARRVGAAVGVSAIVLFTLLVKSEIADSAITDAEIGSDTLRVEIVGHQWWWEIQYLDPRPSARLVTANELYLPVGRPVVLELTSRDVIHSLWIPNLHGKMDLIPGYRRTLLVELERPGLYRGQCAEFCGFQHAHMGLRVFGVSPERFEQWRRAQLEPAPEPSNELEARGRDVFFRSSCVLCHSIQGTVAHGNIGPDLTHLASRSTIGAGAVPNTPGHLAGWILDPQSIKPGANMPPNRLSGEELQALLAYLRSLR